MCIYVCYVFSDLVWSGSGSGLGWCGVIVIIVYVFAWMREGERTERQTDGGIIYYYDETQQGLLYRKLCFFFPFVFFSLWVGFSRWVGGLIWFAEGKSYGRDFGREGWDEMG